MLQTNLPLIIWFVILTAVILIIIATTFGKRRHCATTRRTKFLSFGSESDEFFVPGDESIDYEEY